MGNVAICCAEEKVNEDVDHETMIAEVAMRNQASKKARHDIHDIHGLQHWYIHVHTNVC